MKYEKAEKELTERRKRQHEKKVTSEPHVGQIERMTLQKKVEDDFGYPTQPEVGNINVHHTSDVTKATKVGLM